MFNKKESRPYIGIVITDNGFQYFLPLSSPKPKHKHINNNAPDIFKIDNGALGVVNINNMIPVPKTELIEVDLKTIYNPHYSLLLEKQLNFINKNDNYKKLNSKINQFVSRYDSGHLSKSVYNRCCNLYVLEEKCKLYAEIKEREKSENINQPFISHGRGR
jgi:protein AbiQ